MESNKSAMSSSKWLGFLHTLHTKLRGAKGIKLTGMSALNEINNFLLLALCEDFMKEQKMPKHCSFKYLCEKYVTSNKIKEDNTKPHQKDKNSYKLWNDVYNIDNDDSVVNHIMNNDILKTFMFNNVTKISAYASLKENQYAICETLQEIFRLIYDNIHNLKFDNSFYDAFGDAYEQFKTDSVGNAGKGDGQHFTPISVKDYIVKELNPKSTEKIYEPCCGTGGFLHLIYNHILLHEKDKAELFKKNLYGNEMGADIIKSLMINMLLHKIPITNIKDQDSLDKKNCIDCMDKFDVIATNPPFGNCDAQKNWEESKYWSNILTGKNTTNRGSFLFLIHCFHSLKKNGRIGIVVDRGVCNNGTETGFQGKFRKWLLENANVTKIVLLPDGVFSYTTFSTCIIFFQKGKKTEKIEYYDGALEGKSKKLSVSEKPFKTMSFKDVKKNKWNLNANTQEKKIELQKIGHIKFGEIVSFDIGGTPSTQKENYWNGDKLWASIGDLNGKIIINTEKKITRDGITNSSVKLITKGSTLVSFKLSIGKIGFAGSDMYCNEAIMFFNHNNKITQKYLTYYFRICDFSYGLTNGNIGTGSLNKTSLYNLLIPQLLIEHQQEIVNLLDDIFKVHNIEILPNIIGHSNIFELLVQKKYDDFKVLISILYDIITKTEKSEKKSRNELFEKIGNVCNVAVYCSMNDFKSTVNLIYRAIDLEEQYKQYDLDKENVFKCTLNSLVCEEKKLIDLITFNKTGTTLPADDRYNEKNKNIDVPYYGTGGITGYVKDKLFDGKNILFSQDGSSGNVIVVNGKIWCNHHVRCMQFNNDSIDFIYLCLKYYDYKNITKTNSIPNITWENLKNINILRPSIKDQQNLIKFIEKIEDAKQEHKKYMDYMKVQLDTILENTKEVIKKAEVEYNEKLEKNNKSDDSDSESDKEEKPKKVIKKKLSAKKSKVVSESEDSSSNESDVESDVELDGYSSKEETPKKKLDSDKPRKNAIKKNSDTKSKVNNSSDKSYDSSSEDDEKPKKINKKKLDDDKSKKKPKVKTDDSKIKKNVIVNDSDDSSSNESVTVKPTKKVTKQNNDSDGEKPSNDKKK